MNIEMRQKLFLSTKTFTAYFQFLTTVKPFYKDSYCKTVYSSISTFFCN